MTLSIYNVAVDIDALIEEVESMFYELSPRAEQSAAEREQDARDDRNQAAEQAWYADVSRDHNGQSAHDLMVCAGETTGEPGACDECMLENER
jgi:hypothetical protein